MNLPRWELESESERKMGVRAMIPLPQQHRKIHREEEDPKSHHPTQDREVPWDTPPDRRDTTPLDPACPWEVLDADQQDPITTPAWEDLHQAQEEDRGCRSYLAITSIRCHPNTCKIVIYHLISTIRCICNRVLVADTVEALVVQEDEDRWMVRMVDIVVDEEEGGEEDVVAEVAEVEGEESIIRIIIRGIMQRIISALVVVMVRISIKMEERIISRDLNPFRRDSASLGCRIV